MSEDNKKTPQQRPTPQPKPTPTPTPTPSTREGFNKGSGASSKGTVSETRPYNPKKG